MMTEPGSLGAQAESLWGYLRSLACLWNGLCAEASSDICPRGVKTPGKRNLDTEWVPLHIYQGAERRGPGPIPGAF